MNVCFVWKKLYFYADIDRAKNEKQSAFQRKNLDSESDLKKILCKILKMNEWKTLQFFLENQMQKQEWKRLILLLQYITGISLDNFVFEN